MSTEHHRVYNFSAGPATLPEPVLERAREELLDYRGSGMSVMEMSHRSRAFRDVAETAEADLRELLAIPDDYAVIFTQGGATLQFSAIPMNLCGPDDTADYVLTGHWGRKAVEAARLQCRVNLAADTTDEGFNRAPDPAGWSRSDHAAYRHYTPNETIAGVEFHEVPDSDVPLVADMSSTILSRPLDVSRFGMIYAGAQKNIGPSGLAVLIVRRDLMGRARSDTPAVMDFQAQADAGSMLNTPPTFGWYMAGLVFDWLKAEGGVTAMAERNRRKAEKLYAAIDDSELYANPVEPASRSWMNVPFTLADPSLDARFLEGAAAEGLTNLEGHRSVGGMRASIYNAMPEEGVDALVAFMDEFERRA